MFVVFLDKVSVFSLFQSFMFIRIIAQKENNTTILFKTLQKAVHIVKRRPYTTIKGSTLLQEVVHIVNRKQYTPIEGRAYIINGRH